MLRDLLGFPLLLSLVCIVYESVCVYVCVGSSKQVSSTYIDKSCLAQCDVGCFERDASYSRNQPSSLVHLSRTWHYHKTQT